MIKNIIKFLILTIVLLLLMNMRGHDILSGFFDPTTYTQVFVQNWGNISSV
jgi:hypothetical protein